MKRLIMLLMVLPAGLWAVAPERILPKTLTIKPTSWYAEQAETWKTEAQAHRTNAEAWFNLYAASAFAQGSGEALTAIVNEMSKAVPDSYEYLVVKGWNSGFSQDAFELLRKAYAMRPEKPEAYGLLQSLSEFNLDDQGRTKFSESLFHNGQVSASLINYSYNVMMSLEPSSILITEGESTTAPLYILQDVLNIRRDVCVLDLGLLTNADYLKRKFAKAGLTYSFNGPVTASNVRSALCAQLPGANGGKKFYYALTMAKENVNAMEEYLYVVGLASLHSLTNVDNVSQIRRNLEKEFLMDYLLVDFKGDSKSDAGRVFSPNYLVPMILLYEAYQREGEIEKAKKLRVYMEKIARDSGKEDVMNGFLNGKMSDEIPYFPFAINAKSWEGGFKLVRENVYAYESETTNEQYNQFLQYLKSNNLNDLYEKFKFDYSRYEEPTLSLMTNYSHPRVASKKTRHFNDYPAVNVSFEAANSYCEWLTEQYNRSSEHKYKKVKFRLPSVKEWQIAAASVTNATSWEPNEQKVEVRVAPPGKEFDKNAERKMVSLADPDILYPWYKFYNLRNSPVNTKGCYLGNFKDPELVTCPGIKKHGFGAADGFFTMSSVKSYFPNDIGLYDVVGNIAEMTNEKGKACGGSWNHSPKESTIKSVNPYDHPDASIGFRVFMEVVEK